MDLFPKRIVLNIPSSLLDFRLRDWRHYALGLTGALLSLKRGSPLLVWETGQSMESLSELQKELPDGCLPSDFSYFVFPESVHSSNSTDTPFLQLSEKLFERALARLNPAGILFLGPLKSNSDKRRLSLFVKKYPSIILCPDPDQLFLPSESAYMKIEKERFRKEIELIRSADLLVVSSETVRQEVINLLEVPADRVLSLPGGVDISANSLSESGKKSSEILSRVGVTRPFILSTAGGGWTASFYDLITAFALLRKQLPQKFTFVIICEASHEIHRNLISMLAKVGLTTEDLILTGIISEEDRVALYRNSALFILPDGISFSHSLGEAIFCGAPALVPRNSGFLDAMKNREAFYDASTPDLIARSIFRVLNNEAIKRSLAGQCQEWAKGLSWEHGANKLWDAWAKLIDGRRKAEENALSSAPLTIGSGSRMRKIACIMSETLMSAYETRSIKEFCDELAQYYDVEFTLAPITHADGSAFSLRESTQSKYSPYDQYIYFVNKSMPLPFLLEMQDLYPGIVILLDFFLGSSDLSCNETSGGWGFLAQEALLSYGTVASWLALDPLKRQDFFEKYPLNRKLFDQAHGVVYFDPGMQHQIRSFYPRGMNASLTYLPQPVALPQRFIRGSLQGEHAGAQKDVFSVLFIGLPDTEENWRYFINALHCIDRNRPMSCCRILLRFEEAVCFLNKLEGERVPLARPICILPMEDIESARDCFESSDLGIVLKNHAIQGEWSAFLEGIGSGLPFVAVSEFLGDAFPGTLLVDIPPDTSPDRFDGLLSQALSDPSLRESCSEKAYRWIEDNHAPRKVAQKLALLMDQHYREWETISDASLAISLSDCLQRVQWRARRREAERLSFLVANSEPLIRPERLYLDVTAFAKSLKNGYITGIQRVIQNICRFLPLTSSVQVYTFRIGRDRCQSFFLNALPLDANAESFWETPFSLSLRPGDRILIPDALMDPSVYGEFLAYCRSRGAQLHAIVYDLLPIRLPECFSASHADNFRLWLEATLANVDQVLCDSRSTAEDLVLFLNDSTTRRTVPLKIGCFRLGADLLHVPEIQTIEKRIPPDVAQFFVEGGEPVFLMVGTIEPRKNHAFGLEVFEKLWREGIRSRLCVVGRIGWKTRDLVTKMRSHEESGRLFLFLEGPSDFVLDYCYIKSSALIMASLGEGFGLPVVEAARRGLPLVVNDIPIFRETCGTHALYFSIKNPESLASIITKWSDLWASGQVPEPGRIQWSSWRECIDDLNALINENRNPVFEYP
ncbi:MAG: glycosyltransferase [Leptospirales bacterium]